MSALTKIHKHLVTVGIEVSVIGDFCFAIITQTFDQFYFELLSFVLPELDGVIDLNDLMLFDDFLAGADGGGCDADGVTDGTYTIFDFGNGFDVHDANYDGLVNAADRPAEPSALFDVDADGDLDLADYAILQRCVVEMVGDPMPTVCGDVDANDDGNVTSPEIAPFGGYMAGPGVTLFNGGIPLPITLAVD